MKRNLSASVTRQTFEDFSYSKNYTDDIKPAGTFQLITDTKSAISTLNRFYECLAPEKKPD